MYSKPSNKYTMTDRRTFIKRMAGAGALIATSQLPVLAEDNPAVFPKRGRLSALKGQLGCRKKKAVPWGGFRGYYSTTARFLHALAERRNVSQAEVVAECGYYII